MPEADDETLVGFVATTAGKTEITLELRGDRATLRVHSQWMGDAEPFELALALTHGVRGSHSGVLVVTAAQLPDHTAVPLPPADGPLILEYARVPPQRSEDAGSDVMAVVGRWTDPWTLLLWLHANAMYDDGTQLPLEDYADPPEAFAPVVRVLRELERPWKLG
jgi:hypothetical protein